MITKHFGMNFVRILQRICMLTLFANTHQGFTLQVHRRHRLKKLLRSPKGHHERLKSSDLGWPAHYHGRFLPSIQRAALPRLHGKAGDWRKSSPSFRYPIHTELMFNTSGTMTARKTSGPISLPSPSAAPLR